MHFLSRHARTIGLLFWGSIAGSTIVWLASGSARRVPALIDAIWTSNHRVEVIDPTGIIRQGDNVFLPPENGGTWKEIGYVTKVNANDAGNELTLVLFADLDPRRFQWNVHYASGRLEDVLATLVPTDKQEQLVQRLRVAMDTHGQAVSEALMPLVAQSMQASLPELERGFTEAIEHHRAAIEALADRYREEILQDRIVPMMKEEVLPIVREHGEGPAEEIGQEIWQQASLWRFGWRALYDKSPLPERDLVKEEWRRFFDAEVVPIVESRLDDIALAIESILRDLIANERLRDELSDVSKKIAQDPDARDLVRSILQEAVIDNQPLRQQWLQIWSSPEAKRRLSEIGDRMEPILREIGDEVLGTRRDGIEPGFARVLRNQILAKDRSWLTLETIDNRQAATEATTQTKKQAGQASKPNSDGGRMKTRRSRKFMPYPVVHLATPKC